LSCVDHFFLLSWLANQQTHLGKLLFANGQATNRACRR